MLDTHSYPATSFENEGGRGGGVGGRPSFLLHVLQIPFFLTQWEEESDQESSLLGPVEKWDSDCCCLGVCEEKWL